jgi:hypothetical protein
MPPLAKERLDRVALEGTIWREHRFLNQAEFGEIGDACVALY